jgi:hypothetical protein
VGASHSGYFEGAGRVTRAAVKKPPDDAPTRPGWQGKIKFNPDHKFDLQLEASLIRERGLAAMLGDQAQKIELKTESWQWEHTGNLAIEFRCDGKPSGIATTEATWWVHELRREDQTLVWLWFPIERLKALARDAFKRGHYRTGGGDGGRFDVVLIRLGDLLR